MLLLAVVPSPLRVTATHICSRVAYSPLYNRGPTCGTPPFLGYPGTGPTRYNRIGSTASLAVRGAAARCC